MPIIELKDVSKLYGFGDATTVALEDVNLQINKGEFVAIMGPSGSGKSSLLHVIGLLDHPTHGVYRLDGRSVEKLSHTTRAKTRRTKIGFVFQSFSLLPRLNVIENVALPLAYRGKTVVRRLKIADAMLERVGLADRAYYLPRQLSGGQVQRTAIARALVNDPAIIIADEPTGNLDSASSRLVMELLREIHRMGNTILMVTHNPELTRYATRVLYMRDGNVELDESNIIGEVAKTAQKEAEFIPGVSEEDDLAGVSALMKEVAKEDDQNPTPRKAPKKAKTKRRVAAKRVTAKPSKRRAKKS